MNGSALSEGFWRVRNAKTPDKGSGRLSTFQKLMYFEVGGSNPSTPTKNLTRAFLKICSGPQ